MKLSIFILWFVNSSQKYYFNKIFDYYQEVFDIYLTPSATSISLIVAKLRMSLAVPWDPPSGDTTGFTKIQIVFKGRTVGS